MFNLCLVIIFVSIVINLPLIDIVFGKNLANQTTIKKRFECSTADNCTKWISHLNNVEYENIKCHFQFKLCIFGTDNDTNSIQEIIKIKLSNDNSKKLADKEKINKIWFIITLLFAFVLFIGLFCADVIRSQETIIKNNLNQLPPISNIEESFQHDHSSSIAAIILPPPEYEKATGEIPPGYDTALKFIKQRQYPSILAMKILDESQSTNSQTSITLND